MKGYGLFTDPGGTFFPRRPSWDSERAGWKEKNPKGLTMNSSVKNNRSNYSNYLVGNSDFQSVQNAGANIQQKFGIKTDQAKSKDPLASPLKGLNNWDGKSLLKRLTGKDAGAKPSDPQTNSAAAGTLNANAESALS